MTYSRPVPRGHAFAQINTKTSVGRNTREKPRALHVEDQECRPAFGTLPALNHALLNTEAGVTRCLHCRRTWAELDAELRRKP